LQRGREQAVDSVVRMCARVMIADMCTCLKYRTSLSVLLSIVFSFKPLLTISSRWSSVVAGYLRVFSRPLLQKPAVRMKGMVNWGMSWGNDGMEYRHARRQYWFLMVMKGSCGWKSGLEMAFAFGRKVMMEGGEEHGVACHEEYDSPIRVVEDGRWGLMSGRENEMLEVIACLWPRFGAR
jgi:hypothetical protein